MERQLQPPAPSGFYSPYGAWPRLHPSTWQPHPLHGPPSCPAPGHCPPPRTTHLALIPAFSSSGSHWPHVAPPALAWYHTEPCAPFAPGQAPGAPGERGNQCPPPALAHAPPSGPVQTSLPFTLVHHLSRLRRLPAQSHQTQPVLLHLRAPRGGLVYPRFPSGLEPRKSHGNLQSSGFHAQSHGTNKNPNKLFFLINSGAIEL